MDAKWQRSQPDIVFASDASGAWGYGAVWGKQWLQGQWMGPGQYCNKGIGASSGRLCCLGGSLEAKGCVEPM